ncbi:ammonium transporter [Aquihabitans sp. G128]|uniref:ammonium transporter n=1 Tax=Aquihabitans sp. G128 TaxID=2849779 RepID=UPI001C23BD0C|nr:ammonium transporter [Aquihabitans sp. G128]QXC59652.1 ammonium transporter [Aquihabitans sp. G128]
MRPAVKRTIVGLAATVGATALGAIAFAGPAGAQADSEVVVLGKQVNLLWVVLGAVLVVFMQAGFALVETGFCRAKHAAHVMSTNFAIFGIGFVAFFLIGWPLMFGGFTVPAVGFDVPTGTNLIGSGNWTFLWQGGWAGSGKAFYTAGGMGIFFYMVAFMDTVATIPTGAMAERWKWNAFVGWGFFCGAFYYPLFGAWTWGGGWLAKAGNSMHLGHGYVDFAGSGVVHAVGGVAGLAGAIVLGPRLGKFNKDGSANTLAGHHIPMAMLGTFILLFGWFGFNAASTFAVTDIRFAVVALNTALAGAFGAVASMFFMQLRTGKPDPGMMVNGMLGGLVAITAPCAFVQPWAAAVIGIIAGVLIPLAAEFIESRGIDDPVGAVAVHGVGGSFGVLCVGIFSDGQYGFGWNATEGLDARGVTGVLYGGEGWGQLGVQALSVVVIWTVIFGFAFGFFKLQNKLMKGGIRPTEEMELEGMDMPEMGALAYPEFPLIEDAVTGHGGGSPTEEELTTVD